MGATLSSDEIQEFMREADKVISLSLVLHTLFYYIGNHNTLRTREVKQVNWALQGFVYIVEVANLISLKTYNITEEKN